MKKTISEKQFQKALTDAMNTYCRNRLSESVRRGIATAKARKNNKWAIHLLCKA